MLEISNLLKSLNIYRFKGVIMRRFYVPTLLVLAFLSANAFLLADEKTKIQEKPKQEKVIQKERANQKEAEGIQKKRMQIERSLNELRAAEKKVSQEKGEDAENKLRQVREKIADLKNALQSLDSPEKAEKKKTEETHKVSEHLAKAASHDAHLPPELKARMLKLEYGQRRLKHFREAAENLKLAEAHDLAMDLTKKSDIMEQELAEFKKNLGMEIQQFHSKHPEHAREIENRKAEEKELAALRERELQEKKMRDREAWAREREQMARQREEQNRESAERAMRERAEREQMERAERERAERERAERERREVGQRLPEAQRFLAPLREEILRLREEVAKLRERIEREEND
jgi:hypothetical protein